MRLGTTGHQKLDDPSGWPWVRRELDDILAQLPEPIVGVSSLAMGADQLFAQTVLQHGGTLEVILPFEDYARQFEDGLAKENYYRLLQEAARIEILPEQATDEESYLAAGQRVADQADCLIAVWNGKPAAGLGGTADIVEYAARVGKRVIHLNPVEWKRLERDSSYE